MAGTGVSIALPHVSIVRTRASALEELLRLGGECLLIPVEPMTLAVSAGGERFVERYARAYSVSWFAPGHRGRAAADDDAECLLVRIDPAWLDSACRRIDAAFERPQAPVTDIVHADIPLLGAAIGRLIACADGSHETFLPPMLDWLVSRCVGELGRRGCERAPVALGHADLRATLQEIERRLPGPVPVAELAVTLGMSSSRFSRAFKASVGSPPSRYVLERRVAHARRLLETTTMALVDVTFACGFSSQSHMTFVFVKQHGITPGQYRRSCTPSARAMAPSPEPVR